MTLIAPRTLPSLNFDEAKRRVLNLYREWLREVPHMARTFPIDLPISVIRSKVRREFEKNRKVGPLPVIDRLIVLGTQELIETQQKWKQKTHVMKYMDEEERILEVQDQQASLFVPIQKHRPGLGSKEKKEAALQPISSFLHGFLKRGGPL